jgi:hypothetical protein
VWRTSWLGDAMRALIVVLAIAWYRPRVRDWRSHVREAALLVTVVVLSGWS